MTSRRLTVRVAAALLGSAAVFGYAPGALAQTKPDVQTPRVERAQARAIINQLLREGKIMRASEAKRGMRGIGRSVFQGTKIEEFPIEVIGTLQKVMGGGDLVLIKVLGGPVVKRNSGIIAGMSGSPVYINGKMLGAIAIGFGFPKEPIGGVTPITQMIEGALPDTVVQKVKTVNNKPSGKRQAAVKQRPPAEKPDVFRTAQPISIGGQRVSQVIVSRDLYSANRSVAPGTLVGRPATMLMQMSGFSPASLPRLKEMFAPWGVEPVLGTSGGMGSSMRGVQAFSAANEKTDVNPPFIPGGAIGVPLVTGDLDMSGVGTITFRWGNRILAFGHPMFGKGAVSMPMTSAYIHDIFPSYQQSFKLASPVREVGVLQQDTEFAIGGTMGRRADMVPMHVRLVNAERNINRTYNVRLIKDPLFTPLLMQAVGSEVVTGAFGMDSDKMVRVKFRMELEGMEPVVKNDYLYAQNDVMMPALGELFETVMLTQMNPFSRGDIKRVDLDVSLEPVRKTARIKRISADRNRAKAGEMVRVNIFLEPSETPDRYITRTFSFKVPEDAPDGQLRIAANPGSDFWQGQTRVGGAPPKPNNLKELVEAYKRAGASNELLVQASTPQAFLMVGRQKVAHPPSSWAALMPRSSSVISAHNETQSQSEKIDYSLSGSQFISIPVESARHSDRERPETGATDGVKKSQGLTSSMATALDTEDASADSIDFSSDEEEVAVRHLPFVRRVEGSPVFGPHMKLWWNKYLRAQAGPAGASPDATPPVAGAIPPSIAPSITPIKPSEAADGTKAGAASPTPTPEPNTNLARPVSRWVQDDPADFARGTFEGTAASSDGTIRPAPAGKLIGGTTQPVAWSVAADGAGYTYLGSGHEAQIYRFDAQGTATLLYDGPEVAVTALTTDKDGNLYAGVTPGARVYRFGRDGTRTTVFEGTETFVWALELDTQGRLLIGTGGGNSAVGGSSVYRLTDAVTRTAPTPATPLARVPERHVRALAVRGNDIFIGTGDDAVLYQLPGDGGAMKALFQAGVGAAPATGDSGDRAEMMAMMMGMGGSGRMMIGGGIGMPMMGSDAMMLMAGADNAGMGSSSGLRAQGTEILAVAALPDGIYFGTATGGVIYRWTPESGAQPIYNAPARAIYALRARNGKLLAGVAGSPAAAARAAQLSGAGSVSPVALTTGSGARGAVYEITPAAVGLSIGNTKAIRLLETSQPQVLALAVSPGGDVVAATGNNAAVYRVPSGADTGGSYTSNVLDAGRLVRWGALRVLGKGATLETRSGNTLEPDTTWSEWQGAKSSGNSEWSVASPTARYLQYRARLGREDSLARVEIVYRPQNQAPGVGFTVPAGSEFLKTKKKLTWMAKDTDNDPLRYRLWLSRNDGPWQPVELKKPTTASYDLEAKWPDGTYRAKVEASDRERNPEDPRTDEDVSQPFTIDNTAPQTDGQNAQKQDGNWRLRAVASDTLSPIVGAEWRVFVPKPVKPEKKDTKKDDAKTDAKADAKDAKTDVKADAKTDAKSDAKADAKTPAKDADEEITDAADDVDSEDEDDTPAAKKAEPEWHAMAAGDGIFDARREEVVASVEAALELNGQPEIKSGTIIEIRIRDAAGNSTTVQVTLP